MDIHVNWVAILLASLASMVLGFLWYGPVFGKTWMRLQGWGPEHMAQMGEAGKKSAQRGYIFAFVGSLVLAYVLKHFLVLSESYFHASAMSTALQTGFWTWLGFVAPVTLGSVLWEGKSWALWCFNNSYYLVQLLVMGLILTYMK